MEEKNYSYVVKTFFFFLIINYCKSAYNYKITEEKTDDERVY